MDLVNAYSLFPPPLSYVDKSLYGCHSGNDLVTNNEVNNNVITYKGAFMLGAIIGDIVGSVYEFDNIKTKEFPLFRGDCRFTDDTVCTVAVADIVFNSKDPSETLVNWCRNYPGRGYGDRFTKLFDLPWQEPYKSFGNGAAMRVSPAAFLATGPRASWRPGPGARRVHQPGAAPWSWHHRGRRHRPAACGLFR